MFSFTVFLLLLFSAGCGKERKKTASGKKSVYGDFDEIILNDPNANKKEISLNLLNNLLEVSEEQNTYDSLMKLIVDYPLNGSIFPPEFIAPTFLWHDDSEADTWLVKIELEKNGSEYINVLVPGKSPEQGEIDMEAISDSNELYEGTDYQRSAKAWTPSESLWEKIKNSSIEKNATFTFLGIKGDSPIKVVSRGIVKIKTSGDPVGAPIFFRDVPLMPSETGNGNSPPLSFNVFPIIKWCLRDISLKKPKVVLTGMSSCVNCHSFSSDGKTLGMDMDGQQGDKGMYTIKQIEKEMVIGSDDVITWNSFPEKPEGHKTMALFSRMSPDGQFVASTVNEEIFVINFKSYKFLQVFYPTRGVIGIYSRKQKDFFKLPGADNPDYVQCNPVWSPDGKWIYFLRTKAFDAYTPGMKVPEKANDKDEPQIRYDIYRVPFNNGKGGTPEPVKGASDNGYSNSFPTVSPDNKWLVWTRCKNGMLMRPDSKLFIVPVNGGEARKMQCNTSLMNSWHSFSPNGRWLVFSSKSRTPYTQAFLTHIDKEGNDSPAILISDCTAANRAVNLPEFINAEYSSMNTIKAPVIQHYKYYMEACVKMMNKDYSTAESLLVKVLDNEPTMFRAIVSMGVVLMKLERFEEALLYFEDASLIEPRYPFVLYARYYAYMKTGRPYMARKVMDELLKVQPEYPNCKIYNESITDSIKSLESEIAKTEKALFDHNDSVSLNRSLAELYRKSGRLEESVKLLENACKLPGENSLLICSLAWILATNPDDNIRDGKRAVKLAEKVVSITNSEKPEPFDVLGAAYAETGEFDKAEKNYKQALELAKKSNPVLMQALKKKMRMISKGKPIRTPRDR